MSAMLFCLCVYFVTAYPSKYIGLNGCTTPVGKILMANQVGVPDYQNSISIQSTATTVQVGVPVIITVSFPKSGLLLAHVTGGRWTSGTGFGVMLSSPTCSQLLWSADTGFASSYQLNWVPDSASGVVITVGYASAFGPVTLKQLTLSPVSSTLSLSGRSLAVGPVSSVSSLSTVGVTGTVGVTLNAGSPPFTSLSSFPSSFTTAVFPTSPPVPGCTDIVLTAGQPWHDAGGLQYTCGLYYNVASKCALEGTLYPFAGLTASLACCLCGGGNRQAGSSSTTTSSSSTSSTSSQNCQDKTLNGMVWNDGGGAGYTCAGYYNNAQRCQAEGSLYLNGGYTATQACCACGGGTVAVATTPATVTSQCSDKTVNGQPWNDGGGPQYSCLAFYNNPTVCTQQGMLYRNLGLTAKDACCACGGGSSVLVTSAGAIIPPTPPPTRPPTPPTSPPTIKTPSGTCTDKLGNNGMPWNDGGGSQFACSTYYNNPSTCSSEGNLYLNLGYTATQACCACGGGNQGGTSISAPTPSSACTNQLVNGQAWNDGGGPGYSCAGYYNNPTTCQSEGNLYLNLGYTASQACCTCGGGNRGAPLPACIDKQFANGQPWNDGGGSAYSCSAYYNTATVCANEGSLYLNQGLTANQACCICGGGTQVGSPAPSPTPPPTPSQSTTISTSTSTSTTTTGSCIDITLPNGQAWDDGGGSAYTCAAYYNAPTVCTNEGGLYVNQGMSADNACCACGGGRTVVSAPSGGACADLTLQGGATWHDAGGVEFTCQAYYTTATRCTVEGGTYPFQGISALQACCTCGGGARGSSQIISRGSTGSSGCQDVTIGTQAWHDAEGPSYGCQYYAQGNSCTLYGTQFSWSGFTASTACCVCGGGRST